MHKTRRHFSAALAVAFLGAAVCAGPAQAQTKLRVASNFPVEHTASKALDIFKAEVEKATGNALQVDVFPAMQLGGATENTDQIRSGTIFLAITSIAYFTRVVPEYEAVSLPFLFKSREQAFRVIDGEIGKILDEKMASKGFTSLGYGELGFRHVTTNPRPITTPSQPVSAIIRTASGASQMSPLPSTGMATRCLSAAIAVQSASPE